MNLELTTIELEIMKVLWDSEESLIVSEISELGNLNYNSIRTNINKLLKKGVIKVENYKQSGTVNARTFSPTISREQYLQKVYYHNKPFASKFISAFISSDNISDQEIDDIAKIIEEYKEER